MKRKYNDILATVDGYVHDLLDLDDRKEVKALIESDPVWQTAYQQALERRNALSRLPAVEPSGQLLDRALAQVHDEAATDLRHHRIYRRMGWLVPAAAALILACLHIYFATLTASPTQLNVFGQTQLQRGADAAVRISLVNHDTGRPIADIPVTIDIARTDRGGQVLHLASFRTDSLGTGRPRFTVPDWPDGKYELRIKADTGDSADAVTRQVTLARALRIMVSPDKPVYQPGQTIQVRCLAMNVGDRKPAPAQTALFTITDPKGNVIFKQREATSRFGIASTQCPLAEEIIHGAYTIACAIGETESKVAVEVKPYVLPKFRIDASLEQSYFSPEQMVRGRMKADYFFGKPVDGGQVEIELIGRDVEQQVINRQVTGTTDAQGRAAFALRLPARLHGRENDDGDARLELRIKLTDTAGQEQSRSLDVLVTSRPLRVQLIPESGKLAANLDNRVYVFAQYADGQPAAANITVSGLDQPLRTGELGVASFVLHPTQPKTSLTVRAVDDHGVVGRAQVELEVAAEQQDFLLRTDKAVYTAGETMTLTGLGGGSAPIYVDLIRAGQTVFTDALAMKNGRGDMAFDLPADAAGTYEIIAHRFGADGLPVRKRRVVYVQQANDVNIGVTLDRETYKPGERATLKLRLTDDHGKALPGAVSLAAVDEAVYHVLPQKPGMEATFFNLDNELMQPVYTIYPWAAAMKFDAPQEQQRLFEQAIFSASADQTNNDLDRVLKQLMDMGMFSEGYAQEIRDASQLPFGRQKIAELVASGEMSAQLGDLLLQGSNTFGLAYDSYPAKVQYAKQLKRQGTNIINTAWAILVGVMLIAGLVWLIRHITGCLMAFVLFISFVLLVGILLPSLGAARRTSRQMSMGTALRGLGQSEMMAKEQGTDITLEHANTGSTEPPRVRQWFPETLLWRPELITDDDGRASLDVDLADSITTWRLTASAVTASGKLGGRSEALRVFQSFFVDLNLPVALTRGDEIAIPIVVYNYLPTPQTVELKVADANWFERRDKGEMLRVHIAPNAVASVHLPIKALRIGKHELEVTARAADFADAVRRQVTVEPDGTPMSRVFNGSLSDPAELVFDIPGNATEGSVIATLKLYPSNFSQVVEGLENIFQMPHGCFEQTSSTTYPNVLALDYLRRTGRTAPQVAAQAEQYIHLGLQRLISFEVAGGGFDWFGHPPANVTLTAYGLMEFRDMSRVHEVDPKLIERTRKWLLEQRSADGSWSGARPMLNDGLASSVRRGSHADLSTTAYVAWAVFDGDADRSEATWNYLVRVEPNQVSNPHTVALVANALLAIQPKSAQVRPWLERLVTMARGTDKQAHWSLAPDAQTTFYGRGNSGDVETTALATLALLKSRTHFDVARRALPWLIAQKDARGTWGTTQATVLTLRALLAATEQPLGGDQPRSVQWRVNDSGDNTLAVGADQGDVMKQIDLTPHVATGANRVRLVERSATAMGYQLAVQWHVPAAKAVTAKQPLSITVDYDRTDLRVNDTVTATATLTNNQQTAAPMLIVDLPIPPGFEPDRAQINAWVEHGDVAKVQFTPRQIIVYIRGLDSGKTLKLRYPLRATMPVNVSAPAARTYEYYDPSVEARSAPTQLHVSEQL